MHTIIQKIANIKQNNVLCTTKPLTYCHFNQRPRASARICLHMVLKLAWKSSDGSCRHAAVVSLTLSREGGKERFKCHVSRADIFQAIPSEMIM